MWQIALLLGTVAAVLAEAQDNAGRATPNAPKIRVYVGTYTAPARARGSTCWSSTRRPGR